MIYILEDDDEINESLQEILEARGYRTVTAKNVNGFNNTWKEYIDVVKLYLLDIKLPDGSGFCLLLCSRPFRRAFCRRCAASRRVLRAARSRDHSGASRYSVF